MRDACSARQRRRAWPFPSLLLLGLFQYTAAQYTIVYSGANCDGRWVMSRAECQNAAYSYGHLPSDPPVSDMSSSGYVAGNPPYCIWNSRYNYFKFESGANWPPASATELQIVPGARPREA